MRPHFGALYASARRFATNDSDAQDLVQELSIKAFANLNNLEKMDFPRAWLLRVLYHTFIDERRSEQRSPTHIGQSIDADDEVTLADRPLCRLFKES